RDKGRHKRGGGWQRLELDRLAVADQASDEATLAVDEALQRLEQHNKPCAALVKLRFFAGLTMDEAAAAMGIAPRTAHRYWAFARAWLYDSLRQDISPLPFFEKNRNLMADPRPERGIE